MKHPLANVTSPSPGGNETAGDGPDRAGAFGFIRLALAAAVIIGHASELLDGNRLREPLTRVFGTLSLGELAVDGFFLVSGFLVTGSWLRSANARDYLRRRTARIYPGFLIAFVVSLLIVGPLAGGSLSRLGTTGLLLQPIGALAMVQPKLPGAFVELPYPGLNGAMWTISLEVRCYLLVILLGRCGVLRRPALLAILSAICFALHGGMPRWAFDATAAQPLVQLLVVDPFSFTRLAGHFIVGALWLQLWPNGRASGVVVGVAVAGVVAGLSIPMLAEPAMAVFGGGLILAASRTRLTWLRRLGAHTDISYGLYLYAWPIMNLTILWSPGIGPARLAVATLAASALGGLASWHFVEAPALRWARLAPVRRRRPMGADAIAA